jgi:hypothetical protein
MTFGHNRAIDTESVYNTKDDRELPVAYTRFMTQSLGYAKRLDWVLEIGFGGGRTSLHRFLPKLMRRSPRSSSIPTSSVSVEALKAIEVHNRKWPL